MWSKKLNRQLLEEEIQMVNKYIRQFLMLIATKEKQIKTLLRLHFTPIRLGIAKKTSRRRWLTPVILATQGAEIRRIMVQSQPRQIVHKTLS
jgi:hypothetical protein